MAIGNIGILKNPWVVGVGVSAITVGALVYDNINEKGTFDPYNVVSSTAFGVGKADLSTGGLRNSFQYAIATANNKVESGTVSEDMATPENLVCSWRRPQNLPDTLGGVAVIDTDVSGSVLAVKLTQDSEKTTIESKDQINQLIAVIAIDSAGNAYSELRNISESADKDSICKTIVSAQPLAKASASTSIASRISVS